MRRKRFSDSAGATMVELALFLPLLLALVGFLMWYGMTLNAQASLSSAMVNAIRSAATRASVRAPSPPSNHESVYSTLADARLWTSLGNVPAVFYSNMESNEAEGNLNAMIDAAYGSRGMRIYDADSADPRREYQLIAIFLNQALRLSLGNAVIFPCAPPPEETEDLEPGCVSCRFVDPSPYREAFNRGGPMPDFPPFDEAPEPSDEEISTTDFLLQCRYIQPDALSRTFRGLMGLVGVEPTQLVVEREHYVSVAFKNE